MPISLTRFRVVGLHERKTMDVPVQDNRLVLVGENGTGKSTLANLIYYFLTRQWRRLQDYRFVAIEALLGGQELTVRPEQFDDHYTAQRRRRFVLRRYPPHVREAMGHILADYPFLDPLEDVETVQRLAEELGVSTRAVVEMVRHLGEEAEHRPTELENISKKIESLVEGQFLYLPTYRRIEQDLQSIFRGVKIESELRRFRGRFQGKRTGFPFLELVEFGMEDVERAIDERMSRIKESVRTGLDNLTGSYLRDVIRGVHTDVDVKVVRDIELKTLDAIFARIDEATLPELDKARLKDKVSYLAKHFEIEPQDRVIAHFLSKLIQLYEDQQESEKDVRSFVALCNEYLTGKKLVYDNTQYRMYVQLEERGDEETLKLKLLSSGEKQIVSLFSHIYLSGQVGFFVIIDEPELSLSVPWQRRFLPDILRTGLCYGLIAATHSPFVWENELEPYVRSLAEFTEAYRVVH